VHQHQATSRNAGLIARPFEKRTRAARRCQFIFFQRFQPLQPVLVKHDHQPKPQQRSAQHIRRSKDECVVVSDQAKDQQHQSNGDLQQQAAASHSCRSLISVMIDSHNLLRTPAYLSARFLASQRCRWRHDRVEPVAGGLASGNCCVRRTSPPFAVPCVRAHFQPNTNR